MDCPDQYEVDGILQKLAFQSPRRGMDCPDPAGTQSVS